MNKLELDKQSMFDEVKSMATITDEGMKVIEYGYYRGIQFANREGKKDKVITCVFMLIGCLVGGLLSKIML